jgi:hypothetical protein
MEDSTPTTKPQFDTISNFQQIPKILRGLQVDAGTHHVGGVRLTQAEFENPPGQRIDQTTYFRNLFREFQWEAEGDDESKPGFQRRILHVG